MAVSKYTVKRGDNLWNIAKKYASSISGSTTQAKVNTLVRLNNIKNPDLIHPDQSLILNNGGSGSGSGSGSEPSNKPKITAFGLQAGNETDSKNRAVFAEWEFTKDHIKHFKCRWEEWSPDRNGWVLGNEGTTQDNEDKDKAYDATYCWSTFTADENSTKVRFRVLPVAQSKSTSSDRPYWKEGTGADDVAWSDWKEYDFSNNPPLTPPAPKVSIKRDAVNDKLYLVMEISSIDPADIEAEQVKFRIAKDNAADIFTSNPIKIVTNQVSCEHGIVYGSKYKVRAQSVNSKGKTSSWSEYSENVETPPLAPDAILDFGRYEREDGTTYVRLEWTPVANATNYVVEYATNLNDFDNGQFASLETIEGNSFIEIFGLDSDDNNGKAYYFRIRSNNSAGAGPYIGPVQVVIGDTPYPPTIWSSAESVFRGEPLELHWIHNTKDNSKQTYAQLSMNVTTDTGESGWETFTFKNTTGPTTGERIDSDSFTYGTVYSYKGEMYVGLNTENPHFSNATIQWKVRTAGITRTFSDIDWSGTEVVHIYEKPMMELSITSDAAGENKVDTLNSFPFYIQGKVLLESYNIQHPVGYHLHIVSNGEYETISDNGTSKTIRAGDVVYSKYFDDSNVLNVTMTAADIDLESGIIYTVRCVADMSTGLAVEQYSEFEVVWLEAGYTVDADITISQETLSATIQPYCRESFISMGESEGALVENVTLSVYRREYDGTLTQIAADIPNNGTAVIDLHPALDYARYRLVARDTTTGSITFFDKIGYKVGCTSVVIQWDEEWTSFDVTDDNPATDPQGSGSMLILPYNVSISDDRKRDVALVNYAGRERPVSYHGVAISESSSWTTEIPKTDLETIHALRRLSLWAGNAYVREPSGMGFWATVGVKFNVKYDSLTVPVTLTITRVEGGA